MLNKLMTVMSGVLLLAHPAVSAQEVSGYPIGFCNGEMSTRSEIKFSGKDTEVSAAIHIPGSYAATVSDNRLESINVAVASTHNVQNLKVWVRTSLDGENISCSSISQEELKQGWNSISLENPYYIQQNPENGFYIGYTYMQSNKAGVISSLQSPHEGALWTKCNGDEWTDMSADGTLCIEGIVYGDNLPKHNLSLLSVTTDPYFIISEGKINCVAKVRNLATVTATGFDIMTTTEGAEKPYTSHIDCDIPLGMTGDYKFSISPEITNENQGSIEALFTITSINGHPDEDSSDNSASASFNILENAFNRVVLAEEFTTEQCPNCPRVAEYFHNILSDPKYSDRVEVVCHHSGYGSDWLTTDFDEEYCWFYNNGGTYAPAVMLDRQTYGATDTPVFFPESQEHLEDCINTRALIPALVSVNPSCTIKAESATVDVTVTGEKLGNYVTDGDRITVFLVEDDIEAKKQAGVGDGYIHNHVNRAVNAIWGEPLEWNGDNYSYSCSFDYSDSWVIDNMKIVAFISHYNPENPNDCTISNAGSCKIDTNEVEELSVFKRREIKEIYSPSGMRTSIMSKGLNIVVYNDNTTEKIICK